MSIGMLVVLAVLGRGPAAPAQAEPPAAPVKASPAAGASALDAMSRSPVASLVALREAVKDKKDGDPIVVQIERSGVLHYVAYELD